MKQSILVLLFFLSLSSFSQNIKHPNENTDTLKHNSIGTVISPILAFVISGYDYGTPISSILYKHYGKRFNYRIGLSFFPDIADLDFSAKINESGNQYTYSNFSRGEIVAVTDSTTLWRKNDDNSYIISLKAGLEKTKKINIGTWILGADFNLGFYKKEDSYTYIERYKDRTFPGDATPYYIEYPFLPPNTEKPYSRGNYLKTGVNFVTGFEWKLSKHFNISAEVNPYIGILTKISDEEYYDNDNYLKKTLTNEFDFDAGFINVIASFKF